MRQASSQDRKVRAETTRSHDATQQASTSSSRLLSTAVGPQSLCAQGIVAFQRTQQVAIDASTALIISGYVDHQLSESPQNSPRGNGEPSRLAQDDSFSRHQNLDPSRPHSPFTSEVFAII